MAEASLILTGGDAPRWPEENMLDARGGVRACASAVRQLLVSGGADWVLFWDASLGAVPRELISELILRPGDVWHGGLGMGLRGKPELFDFVNPCWMLHGDPEEGIEASSWRVSLRCCLMRRALLEAVGGLDEGFRSMEALGLDLGYRCLCAGAMMRFVPEMTGFQVTPPVSIPLEDEARLVCKARGRKWLAYGLARAVMTQYCRVWDAAHAYWKARQLAPVTLGGWSESSSLRPGKSSQPRRKGGFDPERTEQFIDVEVHNTGIAGEDAGSARAGRDHRGESVDHSSHQAECIIADSSSETGQPRGSATIGERVTVLVPTVDRYPYLRTLMQQLAQQTVLPHEVIVVDQTDRERRQKDWLEVAAGLPVRVIEMDRAGQCRSRNAGLKVSTGDWILFLDDDDEVEPDLIRKFLDSASTTGADVLCGIAEEVGAGPLPAWFLFRRMSDIFPTNTGMVHRSLFLRSGLFDLAYDRGARADGDLGTRLYRSGARMVLDPSLRVLHHHAPRGGLRRHKARVATYAASRKSLWVRQLPEVTELYLKMRFYSPRQVRESLWISVLGTLSVGGALWKRLAKATIGVVMLPWTIAEMRRRVKLAQQMLARYPIIEQLEN